MMTAMLLLLLQNSKWLCISVHLRFFVRLLKDFMSFSFIYGRKNQIPGLGLSHIGVLEKPFRSNEKILVVS